MPLIEGRINQCSPRVARRLHQALTQATVETLKVSFAAELGYVGDQVEPIAREVIGRFAPGWVWVYLENFLPVIAGEPERDGPSGRFDIVLLERALGEVHQNALTEAVAGAARGVLAHLGSPVQLAVATITGNVDMSVPGSPDALLTAEAVHAFLRREIDKALDDAGVPRPRVVPPPPPAGGMR